MRLELVEVGRLLDLLESLSADDWFEQVRGGRTVRDLVAHIAGSYAALGSLGELRRQVDPRVIRMYRMQGDTLVDTLRRLHIGDRGFRSGSDLIQELRIFAPRAIPRRASLFRPFVAMNRERARVPGIGAREFGPVSALRTLWYQRLDIGEALGLGFTIREEHDGRIIEVLLRRAVDQAESDLGERVVELEVKSIGTYRFGGDREADATIAIDPISLAKLARGERSAAGARERSVVTGNVKTAMVLLHAIHNSGMAHK